MSTIAIRPIVRFEAGRRTPVREELAELAGSVYLLENLVRRDLTVRYKRSVLGFFWSLLNPLLLMAILVIVFKSFFRFAIDHYEIYFLSEYLVWNFFSQSTVTAMTSLAWNGTLMKRVRMPKTVFALATVTSGLVNLALSCLPLLVIMLIVGAPIRLAMLFLPISFLIIAAFTLGVALGLSALSVFFDDVSQMYQVATMGMMYLTPILYPLSIIPAKYLPLVRLNPLIYLFETARSPIYLGQLPDLHTLALSVVLAIGSLLLGWTVFRRLSPKFFSHL